jgi:hypothetical protein
MSTGKAKRKKAPQDLQDEEPAASDLPGAKVELDKETKKSGKRKRSPEKDEPVKRGRSSNTDSESPTKSKTKPLPHMKCDDVSSEGQSQREPSPGPSTKHAGKTLGGISAAAIILASPSEDVEPALGAPYNGDMPPDDLKDSQVDDQPAHDDSDDPLFNSPKANRMSLPGRSASANDESASLPSHRARAANPLIKMADDPNLGLGMDSAIAAKARLATNGETSSKGGPSRAAASKPGPARSSQGLQAKNRSSLLVFQKGSLQTRKGKYGPSESNPDGSHSGSGQVDQDDGNRWGDDSMVIDDVVVLDASPVKVPTGQELLEMAGLKEVDAEALPDFVEDDGPEEVAPAPKEASTQHRYVSYSQFLFVVIPMYHFTKFRTDGWKSIPSTITFVAFRFLQRFLETVHNFWTSVRISVHQRGLGCFTNLARLVASVQVHS